MWGCSRSPIWTKCNYLAKRNTKQLGNSTNTKTPFGTFFPRFHYYSAGTQTPAQLPLSHEPHERLIEK